MAMSEEDYLEGEFPEDDDDIMEVFLIDEPDDLTMVMLPKLDFNLDNELEKYYTYAKGARNKEQLLRVFRMFYAHIVGVTTLQNDVQFLQDKAKELEFNIEMLRQGGY